MASDVEVAQADREAAATLLQVQGRPALYIREVLSGQHDHGPTVQAFARHRLSTLPERDALRGEEDRFLEVLQVAADRFQEITQITAGCASTHGDDGGGLQMSNAAAGEGWSAVNELLESYGKGAEHHG
ncbi:hypothetical protein L7H23_01310 [Sphingopyxis sp. BSN-002]|uniref:hypothetical protein n=1 Tax=Sphingopyxis sp. BSN-002 TaxID=2911495 RepID=UPI001EDB88BC|nr:hypothetical protein [Sphingopyxis sp. BSN-002]UKK84771.1 hypothetical protein L7H23_01310 [Sphingopyxis sp. BSN-002]